MPTGDRTEHDLLESQAMRVHEQNEKDALLLKEFLLGIVNERERKYEQRMDGFDKSFADLRTEIKDALATATENTKEALTTANQNTKDALAVATANTREALATANANIASALVSIDKRFDAVNEFRAQLADQQEQFSRKSDVEAALASLKEATLKAEGQVDKKFEAANEWRSQLNQQTDQFARKAEASIRFEALEKKLDTAVEQLQMNRGRDSGIGVAWGVGMAVLAAIVSVIGVAMVLFHK